MCDQLTYYQNVCESGENTPTRFFPELTILTDEAKRYYWLDITPSRTNMFARVQASLTNDVLTVRTENVRELTIDLDYVSNRVQFSQFDSVSDTRLRLSIVRGGNVLFETEVAFEKKGTLPENLF